MYKGGSLSYFQRMAGLLHTLNNACVIVSKEMQSEFNFTSVIQIPFPLLFLNHIYRIFIEQIFVPAVGLFRSADCLIMLGNFPCLFWTGSQRVLFHNTLYISNNSKKSILFSLEVLYFKFLIKLKKPILLVQTKYIKKLLEDFFFFSLEIFVVGIPRMLVEQNLDTINHDSKVILFYPADFHPHKNHRALRPIIHSSEMQKLQIVLTISKDEAAAAFTPIEFSEQLICVGKVDRHAVNEYYRKSSALLFLSQTESLGMPLIEACEHGLPIIAPDVDYVNSAISNFYKFDIDDIDSLKNAVNLFVNDYKHASHRIACPKILESQDKFLKSIIGI